ncbi:MAG: SRPBCC family protein [Caldilineales bacterium]|nr:SRPBCC family protein [Caldilineales bacterium]MDW8317494.1 SRPBCC family protein [Anaerolineae bacterium]
MPITFDHTIPTTLSRDALWALLRQSFRNSDESPIWPHELETVRSAAVEPGALVRAIYRGPLGFNAQAEYRFAEVEPGRRLRYEAAASHPLRGGGLVEIEPTDAGSLLRWRGEYRLRPRPTALVAALFTRLYFQGRFFAELRRRLDAHAAAQPG